MLRRLSDGSSNVRWEATRALGQLMTDDAAVIAGLLGRLADESLRVRSAAVTALRTTIKKGDETLTVHLLELLDSSTWFVRQAAIGVLGHVASKGHALAAQALVQSLADPRDEVVQASVEALSSVARRGDQNVVNALLAKLQDSACTWPTARDAALALMQLAERGDTRVVALLLDKLGDPHEEVRRAAMAALPQVAEPDEELYAKLLTRLRRSSSSGDSRACAASLLGILATEGGSSICSIRCVLLDLATDVEEGWLLRCAAIEALSSIFSSGDQQLVDSVIPCLSDADTGVRQSSVNLIAQLATYGDAHTVRVLLKMLGEEQFPFIRADVARALGRVAAVGHRLVVDALLARLSDTSSSVRDAAAEALRRVSESGDPDTVDALLDSLLQDGEYSP